MWTGNRDGVLNVDGGDPDGIEIMFRGRRNLTAVFHTLSHAADDYDFGLDQAEHLILAGSSAGGVGVINNVD